MNEDTIQITCLCGNFVTLELVGGQYQDEYRGRCEECGRVWVLTEISEMLKELEEELEISSG